MMNIRVLTTLAVPAALIASALATPAEATFKPIGTFETGIFDDSAAEIGAYDPLTQRLFVTNSANNTIDILDINDPTNPFRSSSIDLSGLGGGINSVAFNDGLLAAAIEAEDTQAPGSVAFFDTDGLFQTAFEVGALPDMLTFTPDGTKVLVANEGEPNDDYTIDPEGSVSIIDISGGLDNGSVSTAGFGAFSADELTAAGVRIFGPGATAAQDLEPEFITVSPDSTQAFVALQENNALGILDIDAGVFTDVISLGFKDHNDPDNALDPSDEDDAINIQTVPTLGAYQPDAIAAYEVDGVTYVVTANEGDARDYDGFSEESNLEDLFEEGLLDLDNDGEPDTLDTIEPKTGETLEALLDENRLGDLDLTSATGDIDGDGLIEELVSFGGRSFSIYNTATGEQVFDSGNDFEQILVDLIEAGELPLAAFNTTNDENEFDARSDAKGPEPEAIELGVVGDRVLAFIGLERVSGILIYDVTDPIAPSFVEFTDNRDYEVDFDEDNFQLAGDLGPEDITFISRDESPNKRNLIVVTNEVSGTTTVYADVPEPGMVAGLLVMGSLSFLGLKRKRAQR
ncbi:MAG: choice-of-anchor I family protein [Cyanobacteria bacterium J06636_16]